jgi:(2Fe-2S) ferredoxin
MPCPVSRYQNRAPPPSMQQVLVCQYVNCLANGSALVLAEFLRQDLTDVEVVASACQGQCNMGPTVRILPDETWYCRVQVEDVAAIAHQHLQQGQPVKALLHPRFHRQG